MRENRTYDQVLGDDSRGDGDPALTLFGSSITPNAHALVQRFPLLDHVYANSEASIDGHYWTAAGAVSDYVTKNWHQNYGGRNRPYDFGSFMVSAPPKGYLFPGDAARQRQLLQLRRGPGRSLPVRGQGPDTSRDRHQLAGPRPEPHRRADQRWLLRQRHLDLRHARHRSGRERLRLD